MEGLRIEVAENGFVVHEERGATVGKMWAFETPLSLAAFIQKWGQIKSEERGPQ